MLSMHALEFMQMAPLAELQIPMQAVFPTVLALNEDRIMERNLEAAGKSKQAWEDVKAPVRKSEKEQSRTNKPEKQEIAKSDRETNTYSLIYFNPESKKAEVVEETVTINYEDEAQQVIEEALGQRSAYGIYSHIASQLIIEQIDERRLQEILDKIKIESPSPFGGGAGVKVSFEGVSPKLLQEYGDRIVALEIAEKRKLNLEEKLAAQVQLIDELIKNLDEPHPDSRQLAGKLPPLSRERTLALFRKKRISKKEVRDLLLKDLQFLKAAKEKVGAMRVQDILKVVLKIKNS